MCYGFGIAAVVLSGTDRPGNESATDPDDHPLGMETTRGIHRGAVNPQCASLVRVRRKMRKSRSVRRT